MKKYIALLLSIFILSCSSDNDEPIKKVSVTLNFTHNWNGTSVTKDEFNKIQFINQKDNNLSIERLRYLISRITLVNSANEAIEFDGYKLVDLNSPESLSHELPKTISEGIYKISFTFGFNKEDNIDGKYQDLNSVSWGVPAMLGGGYHFMQMDGKYKDKDNAEQPYNFHAIQAYDTTTKETKDTFFTVNLGTISLKNNATIDIKMNIAQWFKDPNIWDLKELNVKLMMNFEAQKKIADNGKNVFTLGTINQ
ncbi:MbnP family protein [Tenacibaculum sp. TC6]|uniref:MbnP family protein n=1 Tax=Tenacibaculum sp. TC6 TaxID=3423223 RepID=UPI003D35C1AA